MKIDKWNLHAPLPWTYWYKRSQCAPTLPRVAGDIAGPVEVSTVDPGQAHVDLDGQHGSNLKWLWATQIPGELNHAVGALNE